METRSERLPPSIKVALVCYALGIPIRVSGVITFLRLEAPTPLWYVLNGVELVLVAYQMFALSRLSRWAPILQGLAMAGFIGNRYAHDPNWTQRYPLLGVFAVITPTLVYMALVLPHWRKMNWAPFGLPYRARAEADIDVF